MKWRLIPTLNLPGHFQMAIDSWLLTQHIAGNHPPVLRFYTWSSPTISLGYHQHKYPQHWQNLNWQGQKIDLVRRPTGGRAVLHQGDLTYAVITSGLAAKRILAYQQICEFLIVGWRELGIELNYGHAGKGYIHNPNCFGTATSADLVTHDGFKLIGSAQLRKCQGILQHGSMRIHPDLELFRQVFTPEQPICDRNHPPLVINHRLEVIINTLVKTARECLNLDLQTQPLTPQEWQEIKLIQNTFKESNYF